MGAVMVGGLTEYPFLPYSDEQIAGLFRTRLGDPSLPDRLREPGGWPEPMRLEYGDDHGLTAARRHRDRLVAGFRELRAALDDFRPDLVLLWSKDEPENFVEDGVPPYCIYGYDELVLKPNGRSAELGPTVHGEDENTQVRAHGHRAGAKYLAAKLIDQGFDATFAYTPRHASPLADSFQTLVSYLDWDRVGMPYPIVPVYLNMYGHGFLDRRGFGADGELAPGPLPPWRWFDLGWATARIFADSPWRVALLGAASWSHGNFTAKNSFLWPDVETDRRLFQHLRQGEYGRWRDLDPAELESSGNQEQRCWAAVAGAADAMHLSPRYLELTESWIFNSDKVVAVLG